MDIEWVGRDAIVGTPSVAFTYQVSESPRDFTEQRAKINNLAWNEQYDLIGDYRVYPYGCNNDLPDIIKETVQENYMAPGIIKKKTQLLWGSGPMLYKEEFDEKGLPVRIWQTDDEIIDWLESWNYHEYIMKSITDFHHIEGVFTRFELTKGARIGAPKIAKLVHEYADRNRLASLNNSKSKKPTHVVSSDCSFNASNLMTDYKVYKLFDYNNPFAEINSVLYSNMYSFCADYYTVPDLYGSLEWLRRSTSVPLIFKALSKNSINLKYHIVSPQAFWDKKESAIKENCTKAGVTYKDSMLQEYQRDFLDKISVVLAGDVNAGKYLHTTKTFTVEGVNLLEHGWEIKVIDQKIKDYVDSQIAISNRSDRALSTGVGLHSALGNVSEGGSSDSGSEQIYALKNYLQTGISIPEMITLKALNYAIKANWPDKKLKLGYFHMQPEKEQDVSPKNRIKNIV